MKKKVTAVLLAALLALQGNVCFAAEEELFLDGTSWEETSLISEEGQETTGAEFSGEEETSAPAEEETFGSDLSAEAAEPETTGTETTEPAAEPETTGAETTEPAAEPETTGAETTEPATEPVTEVPETEDAETAAPESEETENPDMSDETEIPEAAETESDPEAEIAEDSLEESEEIVSAFEIEESESDLFFSGSSEGSGTCGTNLTWKLADGVLTISGSGEMDSMNPDCPWRTYSSEIQKVVIKEGVTGIGSAAFYGCSSLTEVSLPASLKSIAAGAFVGCSSLKSITLKEGLESLGHYVFQESGVTELTLPSTLSSIADLAFYMAYNLTSIQVADGNSNYASQNGVLFSADKSTLMVYPAGKSDAYQIPSGVKTVNEYAFSYAQLESVTIAGTVTKLGDGAFYNSSIKKLVIPDSVAEIGDFLCEDCDSLTSVSIGAGLTTLSYRTFYSCGSLKTVSGGASLTELPALAFTYCKSLESISIPKGVTSILNGCFGDCTSLKEVTLPAGLKEIAYQAFLRCESLSEITFPDGLQAIYGYSFALTGLTKVYIPASVSVVGENAFPEDAEVTFAAAMEEQEDGSYWRMLKVSVSAAYDYTSAFEVLKIVNQRRAENGLSALSMDADLLKAAMVRAAELSLYFSHTRPTGQDCFTVSSKAAGENIAAGQSSASSVMTSWMNSSGHKANILGSSYTGIGIGAVKIDGVCYWVQLFATETPEVASSSSYTNRTSVTEVNFIQNDEEYEILPSESTLNLEIGDTQTVGMEFYNTFCRTEISADQLTFSSGKSSVCKVNSSGKVTAVGAGSTTIQISLTKYPQVSVSVSVTVTKGNHTHKWGKWKTVTKATVFAAEKRTRKCSSCGKTQTRSYGSALTPVISLNASSLRLQKGQSTSAFKVTKMAEGDYIKSVKSGNTALVQVTGFKKTGKIYLKAQNKTGKTKLTITLASGRKKKVTVKVQKNTVKTTKVSVSKKTITLKKGKSRKLKVVVNPITSQQKVTYTSSNKKVATVSASGKITAKKAGTAKITVCSGSKKVIVTVKVKK